MGKVNCMIYNKAVPRIITKLSDGDEERITRPERTSAQKSIDGSHGTSSTERKLVKRVGRVQNHQNVLDKVIKKMERKGIV